VKINTRVLFLLFGSKQSWAKNIIAVTRDHWTEAHIKSVLIIQIK